MVGSYILSTEKNYIKGLYGSMRPYIATMMPYDDWCEDRKNGLLALWSRLRHYQFMTTDFEAFCRMAYELSTRDA